MEVVAEAADGQEAIRQVQETSPEVAVVDISMPGLDGLEVVSRLRLSHPKLPILILTMHEEEQYVVRAIEAGAMGYITKRSAPEPVSYTHLTLPTNREVKITVVAVTL